MQIAHPELRPTDDDGGDDGDGDGYYDGISCWNPAAAAAADKELKYFSRISLGNSLIITITISNTNRTIPYRKQNKKTINETKKNDFQIVD